ncbi:response regulator [Bradyrhizobium sp. NBAIM08]|nr:response regulator [Bradyrhizobium sp. NBAIM08]
MAKILASFGCLVTTAASVREAIEAVDRGEFDLLLSDIGLPDGTGLDVMRHVGKRPLVGIALSGFGQDEDVRRSREAGFATHLTKPVNVQALHEVIRSVRR